MFKHIFLVLFSVAKVGNALASVRHRAAQFEDANVENPHILNGRPKTKSVIRDLASDINAEIAKFTAAAADQEPSKWYIAGYNYGYGEAGFMDKCFPSVFYKIGSNVQGERARYTRYENLQTLNKAVDSLEDVTISTRFPTALPKVFRCGWKPHHYQSHLDQMQLWFDEVQNVFNVQKVLKADHSFLRPFGGFDLKEPVSFRQPKPVTERRAALAGSQARVGWQPVLGPQF